MNIIRSISFAIVTAIYPLIPRAYNIFEILAKNQFFSPKSIQGLANNLYIFISVCMLFAFGIRLLNGIINPELLDEKKKGVKSVFLHAFIAVILIAIVPIGFGLLYDVQDKVISSHFIEKILLGTELDEEQSPGQILAVYGFSSFCHPLESTVGTVSNPLVNEAYNSVVQVDMSVWSLGWLAQFVNTKGGWVSSFASTIVSSEIVDLVNITKPYDLEYNALLCPLVGIFILYEVIVMCIDLALRSVKLAFLQLMAPVVLCGYVFKGTELLQKWFKEIISTWIILFLKIVAIIFILYGLSLLPDFINSAIPNADSLTKGLVRVLILIGLLQLIKLIPNIINTIFGTNIQPKGGIKGRLGEMALVGKMAQDAWSSLGSKVKGLGTTAGLGALAAGGMLAKKKFNKLADENVGTTGELAKKARDKYGKIKNGQVGRLARTAKAGIDSGGKGTIKALKDTWDKDALTLQEVQAKKNAAQLNTNATNNMTKSGTASEWKDSAENTISAAKIKGRGVNGEEIIMDLNEPFVQIPKEVERKAGESDESYAKRVADRNRYAQENYQRYHDAKQKLLEQDIEDTTRRYEKSGIPKEAVDQLNKFKDATAASTNHKIAQAEQEKFIDFIKNAMENTAQGSAERDALSGLLGRVKADSFYTKRDKDGNLIRKDYQELLNDINDVVFNSKDASGNVMDLDRYFGGAYNKCLESVIKFDANSRDLDSRGVGSMKARVESDEVALKNATAALEEYKKGTSVNEAEKAEIDNYMNILSIKHTEMAKEKAEVAFISSDQGKAAQSMAIPEVSPQPQPQQAPQGYGTSYTPTSYDDFYADNSSDNDDFYERMFDEQRHGAGSQPVSKPISQPSGQGQSTTTTHTYEEHLREVDKELPVQNNYEPGRYNPKDQENANSGNITNVQGDVNAKVDFSSLERGLEAINNSVNHSGEQVRREVNRQGTAIGRTLNDVSQNIGQMNDRVGKLRNPNNDDDDDK